MKILLICEAVFPENKGGLERWMAWLANRLADKGNEIIYLNAAGVVATRDRVTYIPVSNESWKYLSGGQRSISQSLRFAIRIRSFVREINPDVIYSVQAPIFSAFTLHFFRPRKYFLIIEWLEIWSHEYWNLYLGRGLGSIGFLIQKTATKLGDLRISFTSRCFNQLGGVSIKNLQLPGIHMSPRNLPTFSFSKREDIVFLGRFVTDKQPFLALSAVNELRKLGWSGKFYIIGSGPLVNQIYSTINQLGIEDFVRVFENASEEVLEQSFAKSFVLLHPSKREGYGLAMIEAAERLVPTLLIDYPENASVDLEISPDYVSNSDNPLFIAETLMRAYDNQKIDWVRLSSWKKDKLPSMNAELSVEQLLSVVSSRLVKNQRP